MNKREIAKERIEILFERARKEFHDHPERSDRYVDIAREIGMSYNVSIPRRFRKRFCPECHSYLLPPENSSIRLNDGKKVITCQKCGGIRRIPYKK